MVPQAFADAVIAGAVLLSSRESRSGVKSVQVSELIAQLTAVLVENVPVAELPAARVSELVEAAQQGISCLEAAHCHGNRAGIWPP